MQLSFQLVVILWRISYDHQFDIEIIIFELERFVMLLSFINLYSIIIFFDFLICPNYIREGRDRIFKIP